MNIKLILSHSYWNIILTALRLYIGEYPWDYKGADYFKTEAKILIEKIETTIYALFDETEGMEIKSPEEIMAIIRALEMYIGKFPNAYHGADLWKDEAEKIYKGFRKDFEDEISHLL